MVASPQTKELIESTSFDQRFGRSKGVSEKRDNSGNTLFQFFCRMNPNVCLNACNREFDVSSPVSNKKPSSVTGSNLRTIIPDIMKAIDNEDRENDLAPIYRISRRNNAFKSLYDLSCVKQNRVPLACTQKYEVIKILAECLGSTIHENSDDIGKTRRIICLTLNQLSLPFQNKKVMVFGNASDILIDNLLKVINQRLPETYLCCICLMNLTYLDGAVDAILNITALRDPIDTIPFLRSASNRPNNIDPLEWRTFPSAARPASRTPSPVRSFHSRTSSLLKSIESLMHEHRPFLMSKVLSEEGEAIRWSVGLIRNLTKKESHVSIVARTEIPYLILSFIRQSHNPIIRWTKDSLEAMSLEVIGNLASFHITRSILKSHDAVAVILQINEECERMHLGLNTATILTSLAL